jgi:hypothetical protein
VSDYVAYGSSTLHQRMMRPVSTRCRRRCGNQHSDPQWEGVQVTHACGARMTHSGTANGVTLMGGCEWHVRQWVREQDHRLRVRLLTQGVESMFPGLV